MARPNALHLLYQYQYSTAAVFIDSRDAGIRSLFYCTIPHYSITTITSPHRVLFVVTNTISSLAALHLVRFLSLAICYACRCLLPSPRPPIVAALPHPVALR